MTLGARQKTFIIIVEVKRNKNVFIGKLTAVRKDMGLSGKYLAAFVIAEQEREERREKEREEREDKK